MNRGWILFGYVGHIIEVMSFLYQTQINSGIYYYSATIRQVLKKGQYPIESVVIGQAAIQVGLSAKA